MLQIGLVSTASRRSGLKGATVRAEVEAWFNVKASSHVYLQSVHASAAFRSKGKTEKSKYISAEAGAQAFFSKGKWSKLFLFSLLCSLQRVGFGFRNVVYRTLSHKY